MVRVAGAVREIRKTEGDANHTSGKSGCWRGSDRLHFTCSCSGLGEVRTEDYHNPCDRSAEVLGFFIHTVMEYIIPSDRDHVIM